MANIVDTLSDGNRRLQIGNEEFARTMIFRGSWTKIRIGCRFSFNDTGVAISSAWFALGVCEGTTNTYLDANTTGAFVVTMGRTSANPNSNYAHQATYYSSNDSTFITKFGGVVTSSDGSSAGYGTGGSFNPNGPGALFVDLLKVGTSITGYYYCTGNQGGLPGGINLSCSLGAFYRILDQETSVDNTFITQSNTLAYGSTISNLDTVSVSWTKSVPTVEISDLAVVRFA